MEQKSAFISLPGDIISLLLTDWLGWRDIGHFDIAICNKVARKEWLHLLRDSCIFNSVSAGFRKLPNYFPWVIVRLIRTRKIVVGLNPRIEENLMFRWFQHTGPYLTSFTSNQIDNYVLSLLARYCNKLQTLCCRHCDVDVTYWSILMNNPELQHLTIFGKSNRTDPVPTDLHLPYLTKLEIGWVVLTLEDTTVLIRQLPSLQSIKFTLSDISAVAFESLLAVRPVKLVNLHLEFIYHSGIDQNSVRLIKLMESITPGLRCLVVSAPNCITINALQAIQQYHGHTLRILSFGGGLNESTLYNGLSSLFNRMPFLHTLQIPYKILSTQTTPVVNPIITHLFLDLDYVSYYSNNFDHISGHFPCLNTLSLSWSSVNSLNSGVIVPILARLVNRRPLLRTLCVKHEELIKDLGMAVRNVNVVKYSAIDVFSADC